MVDAISSHSSLMKASRALKLSQPALTRAIYKIEQIFGTQIYERHSKGMRETPFGETLTICARAILDELKRLEERLDQLSRDASVVVNVGSLPVAAVGIMPGVIAQLKSEYPATQVRLVHGLSEELIAELNAGQLDLIVGRLYQPAQPDGLNREVLYYEPISVIGRPDHPIFQPHGATIAGLARAKLVLPAPETRLGREIDQILKDMGINPVSVVRSSSLDFIRELMRSGEFVAIMPQQALSQDLARGAIKRAPLPIAMPLRSAGVIYRCDRPLPPSAVYLVEALRSWIQCFLCEDSDRGKSA
jgi:LysR family pca operon transcriptional activator